MGCDIHLHVERKVGETWQQVDDKGGPGGLWAPQRNYTLFGALADVRDHNIPVIIPPRGIPVDVSEGIAKLWQEQEHVAHTPHYYTVEELLAVQDKTFPMLTYLNVNEYKKYAKTKERLAYYRVGIPRTSYVISLEKMERIMNLTAFMDDNEYFVRMEWDEPYKNTSEYFWGEMLSAMKALDEDPSKVRCVFWFDS